MTKHHASLLVTCPQGHQLRAPERAIGKTLPCPLCRQMVSVKAAKPSLSDTGVMRILENFVPPAEPTPPVELPHLRQCPVCSGGVADASSVCGHCHCYVGLSPDFLREISDKPYFASPGTAKQPNA